MDINYSFRVRLWGYSIYPTSAPFGCKAYVHAPKGIRHAKSLFPARAETGILVGYAHPMENAYAVLMDVSQRTKHTIHVDFDTETFGFLRQDSTKVMGMTLCVLYQLNQKKGWFSPRQEQSHYQK